MSFRPVLLMIALGACAQGMQAQEVDIEMLERCQMMDLQQKQTFVFHRGGCVADVRFDDRGQVLSFEPRDDTAETCRKVLAECGGR